MYPESYFPFIDYARVLQTRSLYVRAKDLLMPPSNMTKADHDRLAFEHINDTLTFYQLYPSNILVPGNMPLRYLKILVAKYNIVPYSEPYDTEYDYPDSRVPIPEYQPPTPDILNTSMFRPKAISMSYDAKRL